MVLATDQNSEGHALSAKSERFLSIRDVVMDHWEREVRERVDGARELLGPVLTNTLPAFFDNIAEALSPAHPRAIGTSGTNAAAVHGSERARMTAFGPDQVVHEYQIFRESIAQVAKGRVELGEEDWRIIDSSISAATREAIRAFTSIQDDLRRKLAAALSHDMRTPLAVITNGAQLINLTPSIEVARRTAVTIESNAARLGAMMGELLDALASHGGPRIPLDLTRFNMLDLAMEIRDEYCQSRRDGGSIEFEAFGDPVVGYWCVSALRRALENLVNNAVKYGDGHTITVVVREARGRLLLSVHNEGNPIPEDRHNSIFDYLTREGRHGSIPGWGIGLQFVRTVAESHGGSVAIDSSPATGTTFLIDIPVDCRPFI